MKNPCNEISIPEYPVTKDVNEAIRILKAGSGVGLDLTGLNVGEAQRRINEVNERYQKTMANTKRIRK